MALTGTERTAATAALRDVAGKIPHIRISADGTGARHGLCPLARVRHLGVKVGDRYPIVWGCAPDADGDRCPPESVTERFISEYGISRDLLGPYADHLLGTSRPRQAAPARRTSETTRLRADLAAARAEADRLRSGIIAILEDPAESTPRHIRARLLLLAEDQPRPVEYAEIRRLAARAGVGSTQAKALAAEWSQVAVG